MDMKEVKEIRSQIDRLKHRQCEALKCLEAAGLRALGLKVGDRIKDAKGREISVTGCEARYGSIRPHGKLFKKNGTVGLQSAGWIDDGWEKVE